MGRKKFNDDGSSETIEKSEDVPKKKEYRLATRGTNIKTAKKNFKDQFFMSYEDGKKLIKKLKGKGRSGQLMEKKMIRHVSLPYHMSGNEALEEACNWISQNTVGKYRKEFKGIVVAVGEVENVSSPRVISDQYAFHTDIAINQIVFIPKVGDSYEAKVKYVQDGLMVGVVMEMITIHIKQNEKTKEDGVNVDDRILVKYSGIRIKNALCHLRGEYEKMVEKAEIPEEEEVVEDEEAEVKNEIKEEEETEEMDEE